MTNNPKDAPEDEEEEEEDLFGSDDDEEEDPEVVAEREKRLASYKKAKEGKTKPAAKSIIILDVKPWGMHFHFFNFASLSFLPADHEKKTNR